MIPYRWKQFIYNVGRARDQYSMSETGLVAGGRNVKKEGKQSSSLLLILSTAMQTKQNQLQISRNQGKYINKNIGDLNKMQCTGSTCRKHKMPVKNFGRRVPMPLLRTSPCEKNASWRLSAKVERENCSQDDSHLENDQKKHSDHHGFMRNPIMYASLGKPRVSCRRGTLTQIHQGVALGRERNSNNLLISESTASLTTKLTRTSRTCKELQNKIKNL